MYSELDGIAFVFYETNEKAAFPNIIHTCVLDRKATVENIGNSWYEAAYGNCLITLINQKITDRLYLVSKETMQRLDKEGFGKIQNNLHRLILLNHNADRIVERDGRFLCGYIVKNN